ncbi:MAG: prenyltransferase/squalene oxidase repeat-containing protein [Lentisphaeria bacterium]|nr:prenyltransferase/squalene oxidase repeat-containing protein [Lentisphaeria bacterium]
MSRFPLAMMMLAALATLPATAQLNETARAKLTAAQSRGASFLLSRQQPDGAWMHHPAITALAVMGIADAPEYDRPEVKEKITMALDFIVQAAQPDGSLTDPRDRRSYPVYTTSICLIALTRFNRPGDQAVIRRARDYLLSDDAVSDATGGAAAGIGYGRKTRADLNNTAWALEALYLTDHLDREPFSQNPEQAKKADLAWGKALQFLTHCQNLSDTHQSAWLKSAPPEDKGGFIYSPAEALKEDATPQALRSYGSMTYSGLKSLIYAKVSKDDVRVKSALEWLQRFYTLAENPGIGDSGYYYYLHTFGKTLDLFDLATVTDAKGNQHDWRTELVNTIAARQKDDGSWANDKSGRWMESLPELTTSYVLMTLGAIK